MFPLSIASSAVWIGLVPLVVVVPLIVFWAWMFKDLINNDRVPSVFRPYWLMAFILLNIPAAIFYYYTIYREQ